MKSVADSEVTPAELAALVDALDLTPGYSMSTGRGFVTVDGEVLWANLTGVTLAPEVPGNNALQTVRLATWAAAVKQQEDDLLAVLTPEQREKYEAERRRIASLPDPTDAQIEASLERQGRATDLYR